MVKLERRAVPMVFAVLLLVGGCGQSSDQHRPSGDVEEPSGAASGDEAVPDDSDEGTESADDAPSSGGVRPGRADDAQPDVDVALRVVAELSAPIAGAATPGGVMFIASRDGTVHRLHEDGASPAVIDISAETTTDSERGLLDIAVSAQGEELFVSFTDGEGDTRLDAFALEADGAVGERRIVFSHEQPFANHNGGGLQVGPDGHLYLGLGDGGGAGDPLDAGQDLTTALGALLRIDPAGGEPYRVPEDNPYVGDAEAVEEIFAYGLRNPWRFAVDGVANQLWIADVGQDSREEVNRIDLDEAKGANFGWDHIEGSTVIQGGEPDDHHPPVHDYETGGDEGCAITGGVVYRGEAIPELVGAYLYADLCEGELRALAVEEPDGVMEPVWLGVGGTQVVGFAHDADGEILVFDLAGEVFRLEPA